MIYNINNNFDKKSIVEMDRFPEEPYYQPVAITIIVLNSISLISLVFVLSIYIINWKKIASFPMRLVKLYLQTVILFMRGLLRPESLCHSLEPDHYS